MTQGNRVVDWEGHDMPLIGATILFAVFTANVVLGAWSNAAFLGDVEEMLVLAAAAVAFVVAVLRKEADARR